MKTIRITGVPEHFNYPWLEVIKEQPFLSEGYELEWIEEPKGSGPMNQAIRKDETELALILTESFITDKAAGNPGKIIGMHVESPLVWGIHVSSKSELYHLEDVTLPEFLISRFGSGSHLMAFLLAKREGWKQEQLDFAVINDLAGAKETFEQLSNSLFLWEKFTTKPLVDIGLFRRIGEIPTPWPCFAIVASAQSLKNNLEIILKIREKVYEKSAYLITNPETVSHICKAYHIEKADIESWYAQTRWATSSKIEDEKIIEAIQILTELNLIKDPLNPESLFLQE